MKRTIAAIAAFAALALSLAACGSSSNSSGNAAATTDNGAKVTACRTAVTPMMNAVLMLQGRATGGLSESEYTEAFGIAQGTANQNLYTLSQVDTNCKTIVGTINAAMSAYNDASTVWIACQNDDSQYTCVGDSDTGTQIQADWQTADQDITKAQADLNGLANGVVPTPIVDSGSTSGE